MKFALCGAGRVGTSLASSLKSKNWEFFGYYSKSFPKFIEEDKRLKSPRELEIEELIVFLALPDKEIENLSRKLPPSLIIGHMSGSLDYKTIKAPEPSGRFSIHPLRSVPDYNMDLTGIYWGIEGDEVGIKVAERTVKVLGGKTLYIDSKMKPLYHMASIISTNLLSSLLYLADDLFKECGINLNVAPIIGDETLKNIKNLGHLKSITGPVERGDYNTLDRDLKALKKYAKEFLPVVNELLKKNLDLAKKKGLKKEDADRIYSIISAYS
jgi:predicted short-subunit dehydrogenase-like oxidoreductase (DUF2520 family)